MVNSTDELKKEVGHRIRYYRTKAGMTQTDLAGRIGRAWEMVSQYERGVSSPLDSTIVEIAHALGVRVEDLVHEGDTPPPGSEPIVLRFPLSNMPSAAMVEQIKKQFRDEGKIVSDTVEYY